MYFQRRIPMRKCLLFLFASIVFGLVPSGVAQSNSPTLKKAAEFNLPGPSGKRFDYLTIAPDDHYVLSAHLGAGQTYVIDLNTNKVVTTVKDTPGAEGVEYVSELKKFYTSNAGDNTIGVVDLRQMRVIKKLQQNASRMEVPRRPSTSCTCPTSEVRRRR
jgi:YVTN family beta-propeller protein